MATTFYKGFTSALTTLEQSRMDVNMRKQREMDISFALRILGEAEQAYSPILQRAWNNQEIKYWWQPNCKTEINEDCVESCSNVPSGREVTVEYTTLPNEYSCISDNFTINEEALLRQYQDPSAIFANEMKKSLANIEKALADKILIAAVSKAGTNAYIDDNLVCWDGAKKYTMFPQGNFTASNLPSQTDKFTLALDYLQSVAAENLFSDGWFLFDVGGMLKSRLLASKFQQDGNTDITAFSNNVFGGRYITIPRKIKAFEDATGMTKGLVMVDPNSFAVVNTHFYKTVKGIGELPSEMMQSDTLYEMQAKFQSIHDLTFVNGSPVVSYAIPLPTLKQKYYPIDATGKVSGSPVTVPMYADVTHQYSCTDFGLRSHNIQVTLRYQIIGRPSACEAEFADNTGILVFGESCVCTPVGECNTNPCDNVAPYGLSINIDGGSLTIPKVASLFPLDSGGGFVAVGDITAVTLEVRKGVPGLSTLVASYTKADLLAAGAHLTLADGGYFVTANVTIDASGTPCSSTLLSSTFDVACSTSSLCDNITVDFTCTDDEVFTVSAFDNNTGMSYKTMITGYSIVVTDTCGTSAPYVVVGKDTFSIAGAGFASALLEVSGTVTFTFKNGITCMKVLMGKDIVRCDISLPQLSVNC